MAMEFGGPDIPISPDAWKRAVYKAAPSMFYIKVLPSARQGGSLYGLRICPAEGYAVGEPRKSFDSEYVIWRKWEDCLWFQETLEIQYRRMAREKRNRLAAGKGVKKQGIYIHDQAASFESLPPGPDPDSVAQDIHQIVPKLTKKGTLFRPSHATIDQRIKELQALVDALFAEEVPTLVKELRSDRMITDFFGYWRRDFDLAAKEKDKTTKTATKARYSISSSVFSMYFHPSAHSTSQLPSPQTPNFDLPPSPALPQRQFRDTDDLPRPVSVNPPSPVPSMAEPAPIVNKPYKQNLTLSPASFDASGHARAPRSRPSTASPAPSSRGSKESLPIIMSQEVPIIFDHNPDYASDHHISERSWSALETLPEGNEPKTPPANMTFVLESGDDEPEFILPMRRTKKPGSPDAQINRNAKIYLTPPQSPSHTPPLQENGDSTFSDSQETSLSRLSWQSAVSTVSTDSSAAYLQDLDLTLPPSPTEPCHNPRSSVSSVASFMTSCSADAIIPRPKVTLSPPPRTKSPFSRDRPRPTPIPEEEPLPEPGPSPVEPRFYNAFRSPSPPPKTVPFLERRPRGPLKHLSTPPSQTHFPGYPSMAMEAAPQQHSAPHERLPFLERTVPQELPPSPKPMRPRPPRSKRYPGRVEPAAALMSPPPTSPEPSSPLSPIDGPTVTIKAAFNNSIVVLRAPADVSFQDLRQRIMQKFVKQEGIPLSNSFTIAYVLPPNINQPDSMDPSHARSKDNSLSTAGIPDLTKVRFVTCQVEWKLVLDFARNGKLTLRIIDTLP